MANLLGGIGAGLQSWSQGEQQQFQNRQSEQELAMRQRESALRLQALQQSLAAQAAAQKPLTPEEFDQMVTTTLAAVSPGDVHQYIQSHPTIAAAVGAARGLAASGQLHTGDLPEFVQRLGTAAGHLGEEELQRQKTASAATTLFGELLPKQTATIPSIPTVGRGGTVSIPNPKAAQLGETLAAAPGLSPLVLDVMRQQQEQQLAQQTMQTTAQAMIGAGIAPDRAAQLAQLSVVSPHTAATFLERELPPTPEQQLKLQEIGLGIQKNALAIEGQRLDNMASALKLEALPAQLQTDIAAKLQSIRTARASEVHSYAEVSRIRADMAQARAAVNIGAVADTVRVLGAQTGLDVRATVSGTGKVSFTMGGKPATEAQLTPAQRIAVMKALDKDKAGYQKALQDLGGTGKALLRALPGGDTAGGKLAAENLRDEYQAWLNEAFTLGVSDLSNIRDPQVEKILQSRGLTLDVPRSVFSTSLRSALPAVNWELIPSQVRDAWQQALDAKQITTQQIDAAVRQKYPGALGGK